MSDDDDIKKKSPLLLELSREDLDRLSRDELAVRIIALQQEIQRTEKAIAAKSDLQSAAQTLFKK